MVVVAIAGETPALLGLLAALPAQRQMTFVVIPTEKIGDLGIEPFAELTAMTVQMATNGSELAPDHVYVVRHDQLVSCEARQLRVTAAEPGAPVFDYLLRSLAQHHGECSAAVLLSGNRADGGGGTREIRAAGGLVLMQPSEKSVEDLPRGAISTEVDLVPVSLSMANALSSFFAPEAGARLATPRTLDPGVLSAILAALARCTTHDFSGYDPTDIGRRVLRRMRLYGLREPSEYLGLLASVPLETQMLVSTLSWRDTRFFADIESYAVLERALRAYIEPLAGQRDLRVWVPACSTGEEAYSIAMLLDECMERSHENRTLKIFGTDLDARAIDFARRGRYPTGIEACMTPERLERFFVRDGDAYRISGEIRERIVFAPHDLTRDPPLIHIDLIACTNLLVNVEPDVRRTLLDTFEYALQPGGLLLLGGSEPLVSLPSGFEFVDDRINLLARRSIRAKRSSPPPLEATRPERAVRQDDDDAGPASHAAARLAEQLLLSEFAPPCAIITPNGELIYLHGRPEALSEGSVHARSTNIFDMARDALKHELLAAVSEVNQTKQPMTARGVAVSQDDEQTLRLTVKPLRDLGPLTGMLLVSFETERNDGSDMASRSLQLESELDHVRGALQQMVEDLECSNAELQNINEELQATNEEAQLANDELSASREELQSMNEELRTLNDELTQRNGLLSRSNDDMHNLLRSLGVATVFVDRQLNIRRFAAQAPKIFRVRDSDVGRPVSDLTLDLDYHTLVDDAQDVLRTLVFVEREVRTHDGEWRLLRISPYRTANNMIDGLVLTVADIQGQKVLETQYEGARALFQDLVASMPLPCVLLDDSLKIRAVSSEFAERFGTAESDLVGKQLSSLGAGWRHPNVQQRLDALARGEPCAPFRVNGSLGTAQACDIVVWPRQLRTKHDGARYLLVFQDVQTELPSPVNVD